MREIRPAVHEDIPYVAAHMRTADQNEVMVSHGHTPLEALTRSIAVSNEAYVGCFSGVPACLFGVSGGGLSASIWMLGTSEIERRPLAFAKASVAPTRRLLNKYGVLTNWVHAENKASLRWLAWLGFEIDSPAPYGVVGELFCRITGYAGCVNQQH